MDTVDLRIAVTAESASVFPVLNYTSFWKVGRESFWPYSQGKHILFYRRQGRSLQASRDLQMINRLPGGYPQTGFSYAQ